MGPEWVRRCVTSGLHGTGLGWFTHQNYPRAPFRPYAIPRYLPANFPNVLMMNMMI